MDSVIARAEAVRQDRERQVQQGGSDELGDVYEQKMDNLRTFIKEEGWLDDIGRGAYTIQAHPYWAWWSNWGAFTALPWLGAVAIGGILVCRRRN